MADTQLERFSCGFYEESIEDKILLTYIETKATKKNRGYELKKLALERIKDTEPEVYKSLYEEFIDKAKKEGIKVGTGKFGAHMMVDLVNDGPVTILIDSEKTF